MWEAMRKATSRAIGKAKKLTQKVYQALRLSQSEGSDERTREEKKADLAQAIGEAEELMAQEDVSLETVRAGLAVIQSKYRLAEFTLEQEDEDHYYVEGRVNPSAKSRIHRLGAVEVRRLEELLEGAEPTVAAELMKAVKQAQDSHQKAITAYKLLVSSRLTKPAKTIAVSGNIATISGWKSITVRQKKRTAEVGLSLQQDAYKVREYVESNQEKFKEVGYETKRHWTDREEKSGFHYQSHAEKQLSVLTSSPFMGISKSVCADDCYPYLIAIAQIREQDIVVADPDGIWLFYSNGQVKFLGNKGE